MNDPFFKDFASKFKAINDNTTIGVTHDCQHCKNYMPRVYQDGVIWGCGVWECRFEPKEK